MPTETMFSRKIPSNINVKKVNLFDLQDPIMSAPSHDGEYDYVIIMETIESIDRRNLLLRVCEENFAEDARILVLSVTPFHQIVDKIKGSITDFFVSNAIDFSKYIKPNSYVLTLGRSLLSVSNGDLDVAAFHDYIFNETYFYSPLLKSYVFPAESFHAWTENNYTDEYVGLRHSVHGSTKLRPIDNWEYNHLQMQMDRIQERPAFNRTKKLKIQIIDSTNMGEFYAQHYEDTHIAIDTETDGFSPFTNNVGCLSVSFDGITGYYIPWEGLNMKTFGLFISSKFQIYQNGKFDVQMMVGNGMARHFLHIDCDTWNLGHILNEMRSNSLKALVWLYTNYGGYDKKLDRYVKKHKITNYLQIPKSIMEDYSAMDAIVTFQCWVGMEAQLDRIDHNFPMDNGNTLRDYFYNTVMPTVNSFTDVEFEGAYVDVDVVRKARIFFAGELEKLVVKIWNDTTFKIKQYSYFNKMHLYKKSGEIDETTYKAVLKFLSSTTQFGRFVKDKGYIAIEIGKRGIYKTGDPELTAWLNMGYEEFDLMVQYRTLKKLIDSYVGSDDHTGIFKHLVKHEDGTYRVHSRFFVMLAKSHRFMCKEPNLQQIPKHGEYAKRIREFFVPPSEDFLIAEYDAAGFQLRIGAILSGDEEMFKVFTELGGDMHSMTAVSVLARGMDLEEFIARKKEKALDMLRFKSKAINFGFEFGSSAFAFAGSTLKKEWSLEEIKAYIVSHDLQGRREKFKKIAIGGEYQSDEFVEYWVVAADIRTKFFERYYGLKEWVDATPKQAEKQGYIRSPFGAIRRLPELSKFGEEGRQKYQRTLKNLKNQSLNSPVQNYEIALMAKVINGITLFIKNNNLRSRIFAMVHDSIVLYLHREEVEIITVEAKRIFEEKIPENMGIPMELEGTLADFQKGESWGSGADALEFIEAQKPTK